MTVIGHIKQVKQYLRELNLNSYKKYTLVTIAFLIGMILFHVFTWHTISKKVLLVDDYIYNGDLVRSSFKVDSLFPRPSHLVKNVNDLPKQHLLYKDLKDNETVDVITIGDSFSNGATQGKNTFYQDYIATYNNYKVLNIPPGIGYYKGVVRLNNSGLLDELKPKAIIIESVERFCIDRFSGNKNLNQTYSKNSLKKVLRSQKNMYLGKDPFISFINNQNARAFYFNVKMKFKPYTRYKACVIKPMKKDFFTSKDPNSLLYHKESAMFSYKATEENIKKLNDNFNKLAILLKKKNIQLYFMPVVDKSNLYRKYVIEPDYPESMFFENLRKMKKEYILIDTKKILSKELEKGTKDLYYSDDTHWGYKASKAIFKEVKFE